MFILIKEYFCIYSIVNIIVFIRVRYMFFFWFEYGNVFKNMFKVILEFIVCCYGVCNCKEKVNGFFI